MSADFWAGKRVLVTGHTGFKGGWLSFWLAQKGAEVAGLALAPTEGASFFALTRLGEHLASHIADINDASAVSALLEAHKPEVVFHLAAQALVRDSYADPVGTFATNVGGVVTLLDCVRRAPSVGAVVVVTSDKCYDNREWVWGYRENDPLGGRDPYSASKGCAEIAARSMQMSFFAPYAMGGHPARIATVRAGNVIGGGDWSANRLVPDIVRGCLGSSGEAVLRNPSAVRPWQHVLEPVAVYMDLAQRLIEEPEGGFDEAFNIGPESEDSRAVIDVANGLVAALGRGRIITDPASKGPHEANLLMLDCAKVKAKLGWRPRLGFEQVLQLTAGWYAAWTQGADMADVTSEQIRRFTDSPRPYAAQSRHSPQERLIA